MKRVLSIFLFLLMLCAAAAQATEPDGYVATGGRITDQQIYSGAWQQAYMQILNSHSNAIHAYQARTLEYYIDDYTVQVPCKPVSLADMTGDGIPELIFMEDANGMRGDLYIYSTDGTATRCALYVPGITRIGYDDAGMNFDIYLSSANGGTLVLEYDEYEWPWVLQLTRNGTDIAAPDVAHGGVDRADSRVGLRRVADHDDRVRERNPRFGKSDRKRNIDAGFDDRDQLRIG